MQQRYEKYKPSGIEWIGEIPEHWHICRMDGFAEYVKRPIGPGDFENEEVIHYSIPSIQTFGKAQLEKGSTVDSGKLLLSGGELLISKLNPRKQTIAIVDEITDLKIIASSEFVPLKTKSEEQAKFLYYLFYSSGVTSLLSSTVESATKSHQRTNPTQISKLWFACPPKPEQTAIAEYLDRKTTDIDALIARKEKLLTLYEEEKTAIINEAVTRGLNPGAPLKDSGIPWLGPIPARWEMKKLKHLGKIKYGLGQPPQEKPDGLPLIRATNVFRGKIVEENMIYVDPNDIPYDRDPVLKENDIIVVRSGAYTADSAIIPKQYEGAITGYDMVFRGNIEVNPVFISYCMLSNYVLKNQLLLHSLRAAQPHLNREELGELIILLPTKKEQTIVVESIESETARIDAIMTRTQKLIDLLKEYRTALISEVVTGKIKVTA